MSGESRPGPDLRLALPAGSLWLALLIAGPLRPKVALCVAVAVLVLGAIVMLWGRRTGRWSGAAITVIGAGTVCAAVGFGISGVRAQARDGGPLPVLAAHRAIAELTVQLASDPVLHGGTSTSSGSPYSFVLASAQVLEADSGNRRWRMRQPILLLAADPRWLGLLPGQRVRTAGQLAPPHAGDLLTAVVRVHGPPQLRGRPPALQRGAGRLRAGLRTAAASLPGKERTLLTGLVDGDTAGMSSMTAREFQRTGLTHLVAVSGENVAVVSGAVTWAARRVRAGPRVTGLIALLSVVGFVVVARPSASVLRAAVMGGLGLLGLVLSRPRAALTGVAGAVLLLLLLEPALAAQPGFQLSVCATLGLLILAPGWSRALGRWMPSPIAAAIAVPAAAQAACGPVIAMIGGGASLVAVPANLLAAPAVAPATVCGVLAASMAPALPWVARWCAYAAGIPCGWVLAVARVGSSLPFASVGWPAGVGGGLFLAAAPPALGLALRQLVGPRRVKV